VRSGRLYCVVGDRLLVYDFKQGAFRDIMPCPFRPILIVTGKVRISVSPDEKHLAFPEPIYEERERRSKAEYLPGAEAAPTGLAQGRDTRLVVVDLRTRKQTRMPTPFTSPHPKGGSRFREPPPLVWMDAKTVLLGRGDRAVGGRVSRGLATVNVETGEMRDVVAIPGDHHTRPSFHVRERDGAVRLLLSRGRWRVTSFVINFESGRLLEATLDSDFRMGVVGDSRTLFHRDIPLDISAGVSQFKASPDGRGCI
jgi:hypothetical protein